jgi:hypothetical protein
LEGDKIVSVAPSFVNFTKLSEPFESGGKMYIKVQNPSTKTIRTVRWYEDNKVITINIPLTSEQFKLNIQNINSKNSCYEFTSDGPMNLVLLIIGVFCGSVSLSLAILVIRQFKIIYNKQSKYKNKLKKILSKYDDCIVRVKRFYVNKKYNMIYVDSFKELLDVYDKKNKMISFKEVKKDSEAIFVIIDEDDAWIYKLYASDME